jgi:D-alanyl-lipoteichoic acid acyltransferase DltB (MBOAT superfamily)
MKWKPIYALILLGITAITYLFALKIEKVQGVKKKKYLFLCGGTLAILPLIVYKYYNFLTSILTSLLESVGISVGLPGLNWIMPIGISFYTFQAIGYFADVYLRRIKAEHNWWDYMLFICFFPQIASGPISKAKDLLPQIKSKRTFNYPQAVEGLRWILWGMFMKVVLADRIGISIDSFNGTLDAESGLMNLSVALLYSFQIYGDFAGYSFMALGVGELMGFELINNFKRPYLSQSVTDFWHRWHISLSIWLKDYVYIPLGGSRCSKIRNYLNIMITFLVSGLWHGANWTFVVWGGMHGAFQVFEKWLGISKKESKGLLKFIRIVVTFIVVSFAWIFFRQPTFSEAWNQISRIFTNHDLSIHFTTEALVFMAFSLGLVILKDIVDEFKIKNLDAFNSPYKLVRWMTYMCLLAIILLMGVFDTSQFIYINF